jgi:H+-translocating NAD(P) transhydrogenase subunit alpha
MDFISILSIFVMACFVGYYVVWSVAPAHLPADSSALFARNLFNFLSAFWDKEAGKPVLDEEIGDAIRLTQGGKVVNSRLLGG